MDESLFVERAMPRFEDKQQILIAGLRGTFTHETMMAIPELWNRFGPRIGTIPGETGNAAYGLGINVCSGEPEIDYLAGVEVTDVSNLPDDLVSVTVPAQKYAIFPHRLHVSRIGDAVNTIWERCLPDSDYELAQTAGAPDLIERYGEGFDPATGFGDIEIWIPVKPANQ